MIASLHSSFNRWSVERTSSGEPNPQLGKKFKKNWSWNCISTRLCIVLKINENYENSLRIAFVFIFRIYFPDLSHSDLFLFTETSRECSFKIKFEDRIELITENMDYFDAKDQAWTLSRCVRVQIATLVR